MPVPTSKDQLIEAITINYMHLRKELLHIDNEQSSVKELEGHVKGSLISVQNLLAYLIGWGQLVLKWNRKKENNEDVDFPETGFRWNELGKLAQKFYEDYSHENTENLLRKLDETVSEILVLINQKSNYELYEINWYNQWTLGRMIQFNTSSPYKNARSRIRKWKKGKAV